MQQFQHEPRQEALGTTCTRESFCLPFGEVFVISYNVGALFNLTHPLNPIRAHDAVVPAGGHALVKTDIAFSPPRNTYVRLASRSGLAATYNIHVAAGKL